ncbi:hypothetical protein P8452_28643 [Trifolium repens]|nr:hypothetical protein P8452_28643 [Trifolium repens]
MNTQCVVLYLSCSSFHLTFRITREGYIKTIKLEQEAQSISGGLCYPIHCMPPLPLSKDTSKASVKNAEERQGEICEAQSTGTRPALNNPNISHITFHFEKREKPNHTQTHYPTTHTHSSTFTFFFLVFPFSLFLCPHTFLSFIFFIRIWLIHQCGFDFCW